MNPTDGMACATSGCDNRGKPGLNIVGYGSFATQAGRRQRHRCTVCRARSARTRRLRTAGFAALDGSSIKSQALRVEGMSISATARVTGHSRNTIARWLERASTAAKRFNYRMLRGVDLMELQADELCTIGPERHLHRAACHSARVCGGRRNCRGRVVAALMLVTNNERRPDQQRAAQAPAWG